MIGLAHGYGLNPLRDIKMSEDYQKLVKYVGAAHDLAESIEADIKNKTRKISSKTVLALSKFVTASHAIQNMLDHVEAANIKLN